MRATTALLLAAATAPACAPIHMQHLGVYDIMSGARDRHPTLQARLTLAG